MNNSNFKHDTKKENTLHTLLVWSDNIDNFITKVKLVNSISSLEYTEVVWTKDYEKDNFNRIINIFNANISYDNVNNKKLYFFIIKIKNNSITNQLIINDTLKQVTSNISLLLNNIETLLVGDLWLMSIIEMEFDALFCLIVGLNEYEKGSYLLPEKINYDIEGFDGWKSLSTLFRVLDLSCEWLILRNYEDLLDDYNFGPDDDIDVLCRNIQNFTSVMNAQKRIGGRCSYYVQVNEIKIPLDIRYVGDKYYDPVWQNDMLKRKIYYNNIPVLSTYDYFFALLYHIKLQKFFIKEVYIERLDNLVKELNIINLEEKFISDDLVCAKLLNSFLLTNAYHYTFTDNARRNEVFLKHIKYIEIIDLLDNYRYLIPNIIKLLRTKGVGKIKRLVTNIFKKDKNNEV